MISLRPTAWLLTALTGATLAITLGSALSEAHPKHELGHRAQAAFETSGRSTLRQRIIGGDPSKGFSFLRVGPGEGHVVREELAKAQGGRAARRRSLVYFGQISDFQLADEESPARVEFVDGDPSGTAKSAHRPQEALVPHEIDRTIRQMNRFLQSPVRQGDGSRALMVNAVMTGDLADNQQRNETEWVVRLLEGGTLDPNSGTNVRQGSLCPPALPLDDPENYTGVQDYDDYLGGLGSNLFYDPDEPAGQYADWPRYPGLLDQAQRPFTAEGLKVPSYVLFGNHDGLVQGNEDANAAFEEVATGCVKPLQASTPLGPVPPGSGPDALPPGLLGALDPDYLRAVVADPLGNLSRGFLVPPDENRRFVDKAQFKALHRTGRQKDAHGFGLVDRDELGASRGSASYYSFSPKRGIRYIVLDTVSEGGVTPSSSEGNLDEPQFRWLEKELEQARAKDELVVAYGHHATGSLEAAIPDELAAPCTVADDHGHDLNPGCDRDPRLSTPLHLGDDLEALFHRFPQVIAYVAGHSHENRIEPFKKKGGGDFWEIKSPAIADYPPQHRLIEVMDNRDGTLSIFGTMLDHDSPVRAPASGSAGGGIGAAGLASVGRTLNYNDPQVGPNDFGAPEGGPDADDPAGGPDGTRLDRNVELLIKDPRVTTSAAGDDDGRGAGSGPPEERPGDSGGSRGEPAADDGEGSDLPFTGLLLVPLLIIAAALLASGLVLRRRAAD